MLGVQSLRNTGLLKLKASKGVAFQKSRQESMVFRQEIARDRYLAYLSPTTDAAELAQNAVGYLPLPLAMIVLDWSILVAVTIALFMIAKSKARWREV